MLSVLINILFFIDLCSLLIAGYYIAVFSRASYEELFKSSATNGLLEYFVNWSIFFRVGNVSEEYERKRKDAKKHIAVCLILLAFTAVLICVGRINLQSSV